MPQWSSCNARSRTALDGKFGIKANPVGSAHWLTNTMTKTKSLLYAKAFLNVLRWWNQSAVLHPDVRIFHPYRPVFGPYSVVSKLSHQSLLMHCFVSLRSLCFLLMLHRFFYFHICVQVHVLSQSFGKSWSLPAVRTALLQPTWGSAGTLTASYLIRLPFTCSVPNSSTKRTLLSSKQRR